MAELRFSEELRYFKRKGLVRFGSIAQATPEIFDFYVSPTGQDAPNVTGSLLNPFKTLGYAIGFLSAGKSLGVRAGDYVETITDGIPSGTASGYTRIANYNGETVWIKPSGGVGAVRFTTVPASYIEFDGINMQAPAQGERALSVGNNGTDPNIFHHLRFKNFEATNPFGAENISGIIVPRSVDSEYQNLTVHGTGSGYGFYISGDRNTVEDCDIFNTTVAGIQVFSSDRTPNANILRNNRIHDITVSVFFGNPDTRILGILIGNATGTLTYNNLLYDIMLASGTPHSSASGALYVFNGTGNEFYNNTVTRIGPHGIRNDGATGNTFRNNLIWDVANQGTQFSAFSVSGSVTETNNLKDTADPLFIDPDADDFRIPSGSPAENGGVAVGAVTEDFNGITRGNPPDIGAYEVV